MVLQFICSSCLSGQRQNRRHVSGDTKRDSKSVGVYQRIASQYISVDFYFATRNYTFQEPQSASP